MVDREWLERHALHRLRGLLFELHDELFDWNASKHWPEKSAIEAVDLLLYYFSQTRNPFFVTQLDCIHEILANGTCTWQIIGTLETALFEFGCGKGPLPRHSMWTIQKPVAVLLGEALSNQGSSTLEERIMFLKEGLRQAYLIIPYSMVLDFIYEGCLTIGLSSVLVIDPCALAIDTRNKIFEAWFPTPLPEESEKFSEQNQEVLRKIKHVQASYIAEVKRFTQAIAVQDSIHKFEAWRYLSKCIENSDPGAFVDIVDNAENYDRYIYTTTKWDEQNRRESKILKRFGWVCNQRFLDTYPTTFLIADLVGGLNDWYASFDSHTQDQCCRFLGIAGYEYDFDEDLRYDRRVKYQEIQEATLRLGSNGNGNERDYYPRGSCGAPEKGFSILTDKQWEAMLNSWGGHNGLNYAEVSED